MSRAEFDGLRILRREWESRAGLSEVCQYPDGRRHVRLSLYSATLQQETLRAIGEQFPLRLEYGVLEVLLPWRDGVCLDQWLYERAPTMGQRRDACLSLLEQAVSEPLPPCLAVFTAQVENLVFSDGSAALQPLPDLSRWHSGQEAAQAACALAGVVYEVMTRGLDQFQLRRLPEEVVLIDRRAQCGGYTALDQLQRDVAAIPDELSAPGAPKRRLTRKVRTFLKCYGKRIAGFIAALLIVTAVLSLTAAVRERKSEQQSIWPEMSKVGDQDLS